MAEALKTFREGEDILASETNENNQFLLSKLSDNAAQVQSYVEGEVATIKSNVASVQATLQNNIDEAEVRLRNDIYTNGFLPNYSAGEDITSGYVAVSNGWVYFAGSFSGGAKRGYVNGEEVFLSQQGVNYHQPCGAMVLVSKGDTITTTGNFAKLRFYPCKGSVEVE
jgi:hypothetical protein